MASGAMKVKVVDSEKTSKLFLTNSRQNVALEKTLKDLESSEQTVVNRISSTQKVTYRRFQSKLQRSELMSARMRGDAERVVALRSETTNTNVTLHEEDEVNEVLKRIWRNGSGRMKRQPLFGSDGRRVRSAVTIRTLEPVESDVQDGKPRPKTAFARIQTQVQAPRVNNYTSKSAPNQTPQIRVQSPGSNTASNHHPQFITTGKLAHFKAVVDDETELPIPPAKQRPSTTVTTLRVRQHSAHSMMSSARSNNSAVDFLNNVDPFQEAHSNRLDHHRKQMELANYDKKIRVFCKTLQPFTNKTERFIEDYYYARLLSKKPELLYNNFIPQEISMPTVPSEWEFQRSVGNPKVRSLTMKQLNLDYSDLLPSVKINKNNENCISSDESDDID